MAKLLAQRAGAALQLLIVDEGFGTQDTEGCDRLIAAINAIAQSKRRPWRIASDFACILTVTHMPHLKEALIGISEFWRFNGSMLRVYILLGGQYSEVQASPIFACVPVREIPRFIQESRKIGQIAATRIFRAWVRQYISHSGE